MELNATNSKLNINNTNKATSPQESCISVPASSLFSFMDKKRKAKYEWAKKNPEKVKESRKKWYYNNRQYSNLYYKKNKKKLNEYNKRYYKTYLKNHPEKKEEKQFASKKFRLKLKISFGDYKKMVEHQNNLCAICKKNEISFATSGILKTLAIDHCHKTGKMRELLCSKCNVGLGNFNDDIKLLKKAIKYLEKHL